MQGRYAYLADGEGGLVIVDVANPSAPVKMSSLMLGDFVLDVAVDGRYAYAASGPDGLRIVDVSNPARPVEVGVYTTHGRIEEVAVAGGIAYLVDSEFGLLIVDVHGVDLHHADLHHADLQDDHLYEVSGHAPLQPILLGALAAQSEVSKILVHGQVVYLVGSLVDGREGIRVVDVTDPLRPIQVAHHLTSDQPLNIGIDATHADNIYVAARMGGLSILPATNVR
jgi:hypothetical protein